MAYGRDPDRHTRGVGAVAARDNAHPHAARARRKAINQRTVARDRVLREITYGPRGGIGAVDVGTRRPSRMPDTGLTFDGAGKPDPVVGGTGGRVGPGGGGGFTSGTTSRTQIGSGIRYAQPFTTSLVIDPIVPPPPPLPPDPGAGSGSGSPRPKLPPAPSGGGGGSWTPTTKPSVPMPELEPVDLPDVPAPSAGISLTPKTLAIGAAAALAAYLLLRKKGSS